MKSKLILILLLISFVASAQNVYYVAPTGGSDSNAGTNIAAPWATWQKAFITAQAGDTVYFRGGVWYPQEHANGNNVIYYHPDDGFGYSGTESAWIYYLNYPGETPILDCSQVDTVGNTFNTGIDMMGVHFVKFRGLTVRNVYQPTIGNVATGISSYWGSNTTYENMIVHDIGGRGFEHMGALGFGTNTYDTTRWINCDSYNNYDNYSEEAGNAADGWKCDNEAGGVFLFDGCRAWNCSDDGFDPSGSSIVIFHNCWSFYNGHYGAVLDGNGFKSGGVRDDVSVPTRIALRCLSAFNTGCGYYDLEYQDYYRNNSRIFNNTFYNNGVGIMMSDNTLFPTGESHYYNNIVNGTHQVDAIDRPLSMAAWSHYTESHNTFDFADSTEVGSLPMFVETDTVIVTSADFVLTDSTTAIGQLMAARKADYSLPDITFLTLAEGSDLIDAGTASIPDIGILSTVGIDYAYNDGTPDLGYAEYGEYVASDETDILTFTLAAQTGTATINATNHTVTIEVAYGTSLTSLSPTITLSYGATIDPTSGTARNFTSPVTYTVTAEDGTTTQEWTVTVTVDSAPAATSDVVKVGDSIILYNGVPVKI